jgi:hypothetical protein
MSAALQLQYRLENTSDLVEKLVKISVAIRKSSSKARNLRADAWEEKEEDGFNTVDLFEKSFLLILEKRYGLTDPLKSRICAAVCTQKHRMKYRQAHQEILHFGAEFDLSHQERQPHFASPPLVETSGTNTEMKGRIETAQSYTNRLTLYTEATKYTKVNLDQTYLASAAHISNISSNSYAVKATIPKPPPMRPGMKYFQCPYCCILIPREKADSITKWRYNVFSYRSA